MLPEFRESYTGFSPSRIDIDVSPDYTLRLFLLL
jgi:hypothetical protein